MGASTTTTTTEKPDEQEPAPAKGAPGSDDSPLGEAGMRALEAERKARREAEKRANELAQRVKEFEDAGKSEAEKLREQLEAAVRDRDDLARKLTRLEVAFEKGLTPAQAKRLSGETREELEADADEILSLFPSVAAQSTPPPSERPKPDLRGGSDPTEPPEDLDPRKLADFIPRP